VLIVAHDVRAVQNVLAPLVELDDVEACSATNNGKKAKRDHSKFLCNIPAQSSCECPWNRLQANDLGVNLDPPLR
jgi:hypothetical protein